MALLYNLIYHLFIYFHTLAARHPSIIPVVPSPLCFLDTVSQKDEAGHYQAVCLCLQQYSSLSWWCGRKTLNLNSLIRFEIWCCGNLTHHYLTSFIERQCCKKAWDEHHLTPAASSCSSCALHAGLTCVLLPSIRAATTTKIYPRCAKGFVWESASKRIGMGRGGGGAVLTLFLLLNLPYLFTIPLTEWKEALGKMKTG